MQKMKTRKPLRAEVVSALPEVIKRYRKGESVAEIAKERRVSRRTIYNWLLAGIGDEAYHDLVTECLVARVCDADEELEAARLSGDSVRVTAAQHTARYARMDLERRRPGLYGPKQEVKHSNAAPTFTVVLLDKPTGGLPGGRVIEGTVAPALAGVVAGVSVEEKKEMA